MSQDRVPRVLAHFLRHVKVRYRVDMGDESNVMRMSWTVWEDRGILVGRLARFLREEALDADNTDLPHEVVISLGGRAVDRFLLRSGRSYEHLDLLDGVT